MASAVSFAVPTWNERRECLSGAARVACFAQAVRGWEQNSDVLVQLIASCVSCGLNTGNWCSVCEDQGLTFVTYHGQPLVGNPLCTECEGLSPGAMSRQQNVACHVCTGRVPPMPPAAGTPNQPMDLHFGADVNVVVVDN